LNGIAWKGFIAKARTGCYQCLRASFNSATLFGLILIVICWSAVAFVLSIEREKTLAAAIEQTENLGRLFEENTTQTLLGFDRTLLLLRNGFEADPTHFNLRNWSDRTALIGPLAVQISIARADGLVTETTTDYQGTPLSIADREHFSVQSDAATDDLFISKPVMGRASGQFTIQLSRRLRDADGNFAGIIVASLDTNFVQNFYQTIDLGSDGSVILRSLDGVILAARGVPLSMVGRKAETPPLRDALARAPVGYFWGGGAIDGVDRLVGYRVFKSFPLIGTVARAESDIYKSYYHDRSIYAAIALIITLLVLIGMALGIKYQTRFERTRSNLRRSEAETRERAYKLERKSRQLQVTLDYMGQGIIMTDAANNVPVINRRAVELLGLSISLPPDLSLDEGLVAGDEIALAIELAGQCQASESDTSCKVPQIYQRTLEGGVVLEIHKAALQEGGAVCTLTDITERKRAELEIVRIAHHDGLTGLVNRLLLRDRIDRALAGVRRDEGSFAILCLDLDRFKLANDTLGHQAGDLLLRQVAHRLRDCAREIDTVARVGGDEFIVLQAQVVRVEQVATLAERILERVSAPYDINGNPVIIGASIGIATAPADGASADELIAHADLALYRVKAGGRNSFCFFNAEMAQVARERVRLESELRDALAREEFEVWYQPWIDLRTGKYAGCEALLRWNHPRRGLIGPVDFIPTAEETGLIAQLGDWVLRRACRDAVGWPSHFKLAINLSAGQFIGGHFPNSVFDALAASGLDCKRLELEITETLLIEDYEEARRALREFREHGIGIALDDFGTGYSSLVHLRQLRIDRIKIDKSFVAEITTRPDCAMIVSAIIALGTHLGLSVTAEGVETRDQLDTLRTAGCSEAQGYLFSRPKPATEILGTLLLEDSDVAA
jgi:diguanylate cyclase (GGDEF)-like protein